MVVGEYRYRLIGKVQSIVLTVIYTERGDGDEEIIWLISARRSTPDEIKQHHAQR